LLYSTCNWLFKTALILLPTSLVRKRWACLGSTNEMFYFLKEHQIIDQQLAEKMIKAVGLRNLVVHEYGKLEMAGIYHVAQKDINDLDDFMKAVVSAFDI